VSIKSELPLREVKSRRGNVDGRIFFSGRNLLCLQDIHILNTNNFFLSGIVKPRIPLLPTSPEIERK
jgi:hypothetical protein